MPPQPDDQLVVDNEVSPFAGPSPPSFEIDPDKAFIESDELYFDGQKLNTSARRFIFVSDIEDEQLEGSIAFPAHIVFVCLGTNAQIIQWSKDRDSYDAAFQEWVDEVNFTPANESTFGEIAELAEKVVDGWTGGGNAVDEENTGEGSAPCPNGGTTSQQ